MGTDHSAVLFYRETRLEEGLNELSSKFSNEQFLMKLAYLSDMFAKLNQLTLQLQGEDKHLPHLADQVNSFVRKLEMWHRKLEQGNAGSFENLTNFSEINKLTEITPISFSEVLP